MIKIISCLMIGNCAFSFSMMLDSFDCLAENHVIQAKGKEVKRKIITKDFLLTPGIYIPGVQTNILYQTEDSSFDLESFPFIKIKFSKLGKAPFSICIILIDKYRNVIVKRFPNISIASIKKPIIFNVLAPGSIGSGDFVVHSVFDINFIINESYAKNVSFTLDTISIHKKDPLIAHKLFN